MVLTNEGQNLMLLVFVNFEMNALHEGKKIQFLYGNGEVQKAAKT